MFKNYINVLTNESGEYDTTDMYDAILDIVCHYVINDNAMELFNHLDMLGVIVKQYACCGFKYFVFGHGHEIKIDVYILNAFIGAVSITGDGIKVEKGY